MDSPNVLVIGAGGFTGGYIVDECLRRGWHVWAGVRASTSRRFLSDPRISFLTFDFSNPSAIASILEGAHVKWDYIVYNLGATKALSFSEFSRVNHDILRNFISALEATSLIPRKFLYMSSLSVMGKGDERGYTPFTTRDIPTPDTRYGASKLKAEMLLQSSSIPFIIFRCTGIYGPHDKDYYLMFKSIDSGFDFSVGLRRQLLTFIYVEDLARAVADALERAPERRTYIISEGRSYTQREFRTLAAAALGRRCVIPFKAPLFILRAVCAVGGVIGRIKGHPLTLNPDKYHILRQRNWQADISDAVRDFGFSPRVDLAEGCRRTVQSYRDAQLLKTPKSR